MNASFTQIKMAMTAIIITVIFISGEAQTTHSRGVIANPKLKNLTQADGTSIQLYLKGDGLIHWFETKEGSKVLQTNDGWYMYASLDDKGDMIPTKHPVVKKRSFINSLFSKKQYSGNKDIFFSKAQIQKKESRYTDNKNALNSRTQQRILEKRKKTSLTRGKQKVLIILADFSDQKHIISRETIIDMMNKPNYDNIGSFRDYFLEASYGNLDITTVVTNWVSLPNTKAYYGSNNSDNEDIRIREFVMDAIKAAMKTGLDFTPFDNDKDGYIDFIHVIHSGVGEESGEDINAIWSHQWTLPYDFPVGNNIKIREYFTSPELYTNVNNTPSSIGVACHEFAHALGIMDYYDIDFGDSGGYADGLGAWELMDSGCWNNDGKSPAHTNIYSKYLLGWVNLPELNESGEYDIVNSVYNKEGYQIKTSEEEEFFVLENRQQIGFDKHIPHHGLLIYKVDRSNPGWVENRININPKKQGLKLLKAKSYSGECPFPGEANITQITDITSPSNLRISTHAYSYKGLLDIKEIDNHILFKYYNDNRILHSVDFHITSNDQNITDANINLIRKENSSLLVTPQKTDINGTATLSNVTSGSYVLEINKEGYKSYQKDVSIYVDMSIEAELTKNYNLTVNISTDNGPIEDVEVSIQALDSSQSTYPPFLTDYKGEVIFEDIKLGEYIITTNKRNYHAVERNISITGDKTEKIKILAYDLEEIKLYPNPSHGEVTVEIELSNKAIIQVFDMKGSRVHQQIFSGGTLNTIDLSNLSIGVYKFVLIDKGTKISKTLIIN